MGAWDRSDLSCAKPTIPNTVMRLKAVAKRLAEGTRRSLFMNSLGKNYSKLEGIAIASMKPLFDSRIAAMRIAFIIQPGPVVRPYRLNNKSIIRLPLPDGVTVPTRFRFLRDLAPVSPDDSPSLLI